MALVDHEAAWLDLEALLQTREGWGSKQLAAEMQKIRAQHRVSETLVQRVVRLYGDAMHIVIRNPEAASSGGGGMPTTVRGAPGPIEDPKEDHDGSKHHPAGALT